MRPPCFPTCRVALAALFAVLSAVGLGGCGRAFRPSGSAVPAPAGAIAATPLHGNRVAVLAGTAQAKGVFILDGASGAVLRSFGVTKEATGISAGPGNAVLLSIGGGSESGRVGAVEEWETNGFKRRVVPLPTSAMGITTSDRGEAYVLLAGDGQVRAAARIDVASLRVGPPIPLAAGASSLQRCDVQAGHFLLYTDAPRGLLHVRSLASGDESLSTFPATGAACPAEGNVAYALVGGALDRSVRTLDVPSLSSNSSMPASSDAVALYETSEGRLLALNSTPRASSIETFRDDAAPSDQRVKVFAAAAQR